MTPVPDLMADLERALAKFPTVEPEPEPEFPAEVLALPPGTRVFFRRRFAPEGLGWPTSDEGAFNGLGTDIAGDPEAYIELDDGREVCVPLSDRHSVIERLA